MQQVIEAGTLSFASQISRSAGYLNLKRRHLSSFLQGLFYIFSRLSALPYFIFLQVCLFFYLASISFHPESMNNLALPVPTVLNSHAKKKMFTSAPTEANSKCASAFIGGLRVKAYTVPTSPNLQNPQLYHCTTSSRQKRVALLVKRLAYYANLFSPLPPTVILHDLHVHVYMVRTRKWNSSDILYHSLSFLRIK